MQVGWGSPSGRSPLTPVLVLLPAEYPGSVGQSQDVVPAPGQAPWLCSVLSLHSVPLAASCPVWLHLFLGSQGPWGSSLSPWRESERLRAGPPSARPRQPGFLPLTPGAVAGGCWASVDKGLAAWLRLIRSQADPGGNQRAGISESNLMPRPSQSGLSLTPQGLTFPSPCHWRDPGPLRTQPQCTAESEMPGCMQRGN